MRSNLSGADLPHTPTPRKDSHCRNGGEISEEEEQEHGEAEEGMKTSSHSGGQHTESSGGRLKLQWHQLY